VHGERAVCRFRPFGLRLVPVKLYAVAVRIAQVQRFAHPMIAGAVKLYPFGQKPLQRIGEVGTCRIENCQMIKARSSWRRRPSALALPGVEPDVVMITAGRDECCLRSVFLHQLESQDAAVELECAIKIGNFQMNMADLGSRGNWFGCGGHGPALCNWLGYIFYSAATSGRNIRLIDWHANKPEIGIVPEAPAP
jgi:hypothetical protein